MNNLFKEQISLEENAINEAVEQYSRYMGNKRVKLAPEFAILKEVMPKYIEGLNRYKTPGKGKKSTPQREMLCSIPSADAAYLVLNTVISKSMDKHANIPIQNIAIKIGAELIDHIDYIKFKNYCAENNLEELKYIQKNSAASTPWKIRMQVRSAMIKNGVYEPTTQLNVTKAATILRTIPEEQYTELDMYHVGSAALDILLTTTDLFTISEGRSAKNNICSFLRPTAKAEEWINDIHTMSAIARPKYLPCVIPPKEWKDLVGGGYYLKRGKSVLSLLRTRNKIAFEVNVDKDLSGVFNAVNALQNTAWMINKEVLDVMVACKGELLPNPDDVYVPELMADNREDIERLRLQMPATMKRMWRTRLLALENVASIKSQLFAAKQSIEIAQKMAQYPKLYFPHTLDYRGRAYPVPSYLNPQGHDVAKALLKFAEGKPLGESGAYWLAVHGANCWGNSVDKLPFDERVAWVHTNTPAILKSAAEAKSDTFWHGAEDRWQFLAFCLEWARHSEPGFVSHLSVSLDGSCNGLQHLTMLLKDKKGGALVNLIKSSNPSDVYTSVKDYASNIVEQEAPTNADAARWVRLVDRKLVKRPTMTQGYGVTASGIREQLSTEVRKRNNAYKSVQDNLHPSVDYLGKIIDGTIKQIMPGVSIVKETLREVAALFVEANLPIKWVTPIGLEVVQRKFKQKQIRVESFRGTAKLRGGHQAVRCRLNQDTNVYDKMGQMNSLVPNVIHSLDAAHMMRVVNECGSRGITYFHGVHDSFGTHACNIDELHEVIRLEFATMYGENVLENLLDQFKEQLPDTLKEKMPALPKMGALTPYDVLDATYFFA